MNRITEHPILSPAEGRVEARFSFDGKPASGYEGEPISSALAAMGVARFSSHAKDGAPQGIFCANGQCSQCALVVDGVALKSCVTPLRSGMDVRSVEGLPPLPVADAPRALSKPRRLSCEVLVIGGGPSGLAATVELAKLGLSVILADDKADLGGKLVLQTHKFFGSEADCYAGTRGIDIARRLSDEARALPGVTVLANSPVVGLYADRAAGVLADYREYILVDFKAVLVAAGARERSVLFPGNDLPGVYGAGAFQTLVNRDLVKSSKRVLVLGSGNVGLIAAYHALQAGIEVAGIVEILPQVNGYKVHADKIVRAGVPVYLNATVVEVEGAGRVERATVAEVDEKRRPVLSTARTYEVDTVLVAAGLSPCDEFLRQAEAFGIPAVAAGDAEEIAEASSAMFGGRIAALSLAKLLGRKVELDESWVAKREVLRSRPGDTVPREPVIPEKGTWKPVFHCVQEIPCDPCTTVCPTHSISLKPVRGSIMDLPRYSGKDCRGCNACVAACPGLAVSLVKGLDGGMAEVVLPFEFPAPFAPGSKLALLDREGALLGEGELAKKVFNRKYKTWLLTVAAPSEIAVRAIGVRVQAEKATRSLPAARFARLPDEAIVCRCERVTVGEIVRFIKEYRIRDANQLKSLRVGMGACGSKTCAPLLPQVFRQAGVDPAEVAGLTLRPLSIEVPLGTFAGAASGIAALPAGKDGTK
ncbi:MAG: FAD-dependent oxidoreductase [Spirochaetia bacterium]|nr:FAD-dependent oxidoreductase [Spirochaetia bacterium]